MWRRHQTASPRNRKAARYPPLPSHAALNLHIIAANSHHNQTTTTARHHPEAFPADNQVATRSQLRTVLSCALAARPLSPVRRRPGTLNHVSCEPATIRYKEIRPITNEQASGNCASGPLFAKDSRAADSKWTTGKHHARPRYLDCHFRPLGIFTLRWRERGTMISLYVYPSMRCQVVIR